MPKPYIFLPEAELVKFKNWTDRLTKENRQQCDRLLRNTGMIIQRRAMKDAPVDKGFLRGSIGMKVNGQMSVSIWAGGMGKGVNVKYAPYVEFGTGSGVSVPAELQEYAMQFKGAGIRQVNRKARPYFFPAVRLSVKEMFQKLKEMGFQ